MHYDQGKGSLILAVVFLGLCCFGIASACRVSSSKWDDGRAVVFIISIWAVPAIVSLLYLLQDLLRWGAEGAGLFIQFVFLAFGFSGLPLVWLEAVHGFAAVWKDSKEVLAQLKGVVGGK